MLFEKPNDQIRSILKSLQCTVLLDLILSAESLWVHWVHCESLLYQPAQILTNRFHHHLVLRKMYSTTLHLSLTLLLIYMSVCSWSSQHLSVSQSDSLYSFDSPPVIEKYGATLKCFPMPKCQVISVRPSADSLISASSIPSFHWHLLSLKICH